MALTPDERANKILELAKRATVLPPAQQDELIAYMGELTPSGRQSC